jgi:hypothetical protein
MENAPVQTVSVPASQDGLIKAAKAARSVLKGVAGLFALGLGLPFVTSGVVVPMLLGALVTYTGGRQLFEAGKELLPLKAQSFISTLFTGKELTEITPVKQPTTLLGKAFRLAEYAVLGFTGAAAFAAGGFVLGMGGQDPSIARLMLAGMGTAVSGAVNVVSEAVSGIRGLISLSRKNQPDVTQPVTTAPAGPDLSPQPALTAKATEPAFNQAANPSQPENASAPAPKNTPAPEQPKP